MLGFKKKPIEPLDLDEPQERLIPPANLNEQDFVMSSPMGLLSRHPIKGVVLEGRAMAMARLCVEIYGQAKKMEREMKLMTAREDERHGWSEFGKHFVVVCPISVIPVGADGTWIVNLRTTHLTNAGHPGLLRTTFIFNENVSDLSKPSRSMQFDWVVAVKGGNYVIVGNREKLGGLSEIELNEKLKREGYSEIGVISIAEEDRRMGFMVK